MNAARNHTESVIELRRQFQDAVERAALTGVVPETFVGDPTFENAVCKRRKTAEGADSSA